MLETIGRDFRYAVRSLIRRPLVTGVAVVSLALGIGVNTAIFSVFERLLLRNLPVPAPEEIVHITSPGPKPGGTSTDAAGGRDHVFSYPLFRDLEQLENTRFAQIAAHRGFAANLAHRGQSERGEGVLVSGGYFRALGLIPALGRLLTDGDDLGPGADPVVVLSHRYWTTRFAADPGMIGDALTVNGEPMTIVGITPLGFSGTTTTDVPQVFVPLAMRKKVSPAGDERNDHWLYLFGRLTPGVTRDQAQATINVPFSAIIRDVEFPIQRSGLTESERQQFLTRQIVLEEGARGRNANRDQVRTMFVLLLAVTGLVLLIACANLAHLMLARAADRSGEVAVRLSIGASAGTVIRLFMAEACLLGFLGGAGALVVGDVAIDLLLAMMPAEDSALFAFDVNLTVLVFTVLLGLAATVVFGLLPAVYSLRPTLASAVHASSARVSNTRLATRFRTGLATAQIALATRFPRLVTNNPASARSAVAARITRLVLGHVSRMAVAGGIAGCAAAPGLGRLTQSLLFGVEGVEPLVMAGAAIGVMVVALAAAMVPARRAARVDPIGAIKAE